jgi:hypothetical protein
MFIIIIIIPSPSEMSEMRTVEFEAAATQTKQQETSATDSDKSEPRLTLSERMKGLERELRVLSESFKSIFRGKKWARKAYRRRERRRAERQQEVGHKPQFPADRLQNPVIVEGNGNKAEEGTQSPKDWEPSKIEEARDDRVEFRESQQLSGWELADTQTLIPQESGSNREDLIVLGRTSVSTRSELGSARRTTQVALAARPNEKRATPGALETGGRSREVSCTRN